MTKRIKVAILTAYRLDFVKNMGEQIPVFIPAEYYLIEHLRKYPDLDIDVITVSNEIEHNKTINKDNIKLHYLSSPQLPRLITDLTVNQYKVIQKIRELKPDLIHAQMTAPLYGFTASLIAKKYPIILTVHGIVREEAKSWRGIMGYIRGTIFRLMELYALKRIGTITVGTLYVKRKIEPICDGEIHILPVVMSEEYFDIKDNEKNDRLLFIGGIEPRKGLINLLKAVEIIKKTRSTIDLHIVGKIRKQYYFNELQRYIKKNNLKENVTFTGFLNQSDLKKEYGECSVFVFPSFEESQGVVLSEAMAAGKPIVASNIGGIPYVVDNNETGFLVEYGDIEELAKKILELLGNRILRREMGKQGKEKARRYLSQNIAQKTYEIYKKVISE